MTNTAAVLDDAARLRNELADALLAKGSITGESWDLGSFDGWYDLSATVAGDSAYLRRFTGHYETGLPTVTG